MAVISKEFLSGSTNGRGIKIAATATAGTLIHTAHATAKDEVWIWVVNSDAGNPKKLTVEWGGTTAPDDLVEFDDLPAEAGAVCIVPGWVISNSLAVRIFAETTNLLVAFGFVNRIT